MNTTTTPPSKSSKKDRFSSLSEDSGNAFLKKTTKYEKVNERWNDLKSDPMEQRDQQYNNNYDSFGNDSKFSEKNNFKKPTYLRRPFFIPTNKTSNKKEEKKVFAFNDNDFPDLQEK